MVGDFRVIIRKVGVQAGLMEYLGHHRKEAWTPRGSFETRSVRPRSERGVLLPTIGELRVHIEVNNLNSLYRLR